tara:strand:- start:317 stop:496 length:180 start_codon:yes stop_codon:yes gene_type:complete
VVEVVELLLLQLLLQESEDREDQVVVEQVIVADFVLPTLGVVEQQVKVVMVVLDIHVQV